MVEIIVELHESSVVSEGEVSTAPFTRVLTREICCTFHRSPRGDSIFSWVGVIMYLPPAGESSETDEQRTEITTAFNSYQRTLEDRLWDKY